MKNQDLKELSINELMEIQGGGAIGTAIKLIKKGYKAAKTHIDDFIEGWNQG